jgi:hypothetical protein
MDALIELAKEPYLKNAILSIHFNQQGHMGLTTTSIFISLS